MNRRTWIASVAVGATFFVTRPRIGRNRDRDSRSVVPSALAFRLEVETTLFHTVSSASSGVAQSVDFSNDAVWSALATEAFAAAARTTAFDPGAEGTGSPEEPGLPVTVAVLRCFEQQPDLQLLVTCRASDARARAVVSLLEGDRDGFVRAVRGFQTASTDPAPSFTLLEQEAAERAGDDALAWLRRRLSYIDSSISRPQTDGSRPELVELLFFAPHDRSDVAIPPEPELVTSMVRLE